MPWRFNKLGIEPARIEAMHAAYEQACSELELSQPSDAVTAILVTKIIEMSTAGECDPRRLCEAAVAYFRADAVRNGHSES